MHTLHVVILLTLRTKQKTKYEVSPHQELFTNQYQYHYISSQPQQLTYMQTKSCHLDYPYILVVALSLNLFPVEESYFAPL